MHQIVTGQKNLWVLHNTSSQQRTDKIDECKHPQATNSRQGIHEYDSQTLGGIKSVQQSSAYKN